MKHFIEIDAIELSPQMAEVLNVEPGTIMVSFPGGFQQLMPATVLAAIINKRQERQEALPTPRPASIPPQPDRPEEDGPPPPEDLKTRVCIECGASSANIMPSGKCFKCSTVKCPTCGAHHKRDQMVGQYCPTCLGRPARDGTTE
jgi:hypothetical protein